MRRWLQYGGFAAGIVLIAFGVVAIFMGISGRSTVRDNLRQEKIVGSADMTPAGIATEAKAAGLKNVSLPTCSVAGKTVVTGADARCFASYMRIHGLEASGGLTYSQMPRYASADGKGTNDAAAASQSGGKPLDNPVRAVWVSETAFSTALNVSYMADQLALFGVVVGIALLLSGIGFIVLAAYGVLRLAIPEPKTAKTAVGPSPAAASV
jgi:F0F1-type ATP synthase membrane subunit c/vacuolar-type H+-ATPase subunit K